MQVNTRTVHYTNRLLNNNISYLLRWKDLSLGCTSTKSTTKSRIRATELAVDATIDRAGIPSGEDGSLSVDKEKKTS